MEKNKARKSAARPRRVLSDEARMAMGNAGRKAQNARWGGIGKGVSIRLDAETVEMLKTVQERDRRRVAHDGVARAVDEYRRSQCV